MRNVWLSFSVVAVVFAFSGCSKNNTGPSNQATVMFVDGCSAPSNIDTKINTVKLNAASNIPFFNNSGYVKLTAGSNVAINFYLTSGGDPLCSGTPTLVAGDNYSVFAGGLVTGPLFVVTSDNLAMPTTGNAKVRFINLSTDTLNETFSVGSQTLDSNIVSTQCTPFFEITAVTGAGVSAVDPAHTAPIYLAQLTNQTFLAGKIYTIMLTGTHGASAGSSGVLTLTVINNN
jgi:hypothetical protein